ncbi:MAG: cystathionine beta-lyase/cystathionine gamma-synthase, partial [bacterium]
MEAKKMLNYIKAVLENMPKGWLSITTHRLDIYDEKLAKTQFLGQFEGLFNNNNSESSALNELPTAYDYIRLGHPLSSILEWGIARLNNTKAENVIGFSSQTIPMLAILRKNLLDNKNTQIVYTGALPNTFDTDLLKQVYGYPFELKHVADITEIPEFKGSSIFFSQQEDICNFDLSSKIDFFINAHPRLGSILLVNGKPNENYISEIQHVRRRETIAMTPANCLTALKELVQTSYSDSRKNNTDADKALVLTTIKDITGAPTKALVGSSGLSIQYAIMMGLIQHAQENYKGKKIKFIVPPNCYGGTNDQARRVASCLADVEVVDLPVDGDSDMVQSLETVLTKIAREDAIPYIIAEIPTNPRVEVPDLNQLR